MAVNTVVRKNVQNLLEKEMDRKDFLKHIGIAVVMVTGVGAVLSSLTQQKPSILQQNQAQGYGSMPYGGR
jgi:hypothetical protein